jgi:hypothetical protein
MVPFKKPGASEPYDAMGAEAARLALKDAGLEYSEVQQAYAGFVYGDSTSGQQALYKVGLTGIPIVNVNNACATGSTALFLARQAVAHGVCDVALALGFEQMNPGALGVTATDRPSIMGQQLAHAHETIEWNDQVPMAALLFGSAGQEHQRKYGTSNEAFGRISVKARDHASRNPHAIFRDKLTLKSGALEYELETIPSEWSSLWYTTPHAACFPVRRNGQLFLAAFVCTTPKPLTEGIWFGDAAQPRPDSARNSVVLVAAGVQVLLLWWLGLAP